MVILQEELDKVKAHWNSHLIRDSRHDTISGRPDELYLLPECHGGEENLLMHISEDRINQMNHAMLQFEEETNTYQEYFQYILDNSDF